MNLNVNSTQSNPAFQAKVTASRNFRKLGDSDRILSVMQNNLKKIGDDSFKIHLKKEGDNVTATLKKKCGLFYRDERKLSCLYDALDSNNNEEISKFSNDIGALISKMWNKYKIFMSYMA